ncbi:MAG: hypothetical protein M3O22_09295, partial [Pseudomonadota bacterium]|nr:hypothetical protein [Pseudomonadota bacterium]
PPPPPKKRVIPLSPVFTDLASLRRDPLIRLRNDIARAFRNGTSDLGPLWGRVRALDPALAGTVDAIRIISLTGKKAGHINTPSTELAWAQRIFQETRNLEPEDALEHPVFRAVTRGDDVRLVLGRCVREIIRIPGIDPSYTIAWGPPGSWFTC